MIHHPVSPEKSLEFLEQPPGSFEQVPESKSEQLPELEQLPESNTPERDSELLVFDIGRLDSKKADAEGENPEGTNADFFEADIWLAHDIDAEAAIEEADADFIAKVAAYKSALESGKRATAEGVNNNASSLEFYSGMLNAGKEDIEAYAKSENAAGTTAEDAVFSGSFFGSTNKLDTDVPAQFGEGKENESQTLASGKFSK